MHDSVHLCDYISAFGLDVFILLWHCYFNAFTLKNDKLIKLII